LADESLTGLGPFATHADIGVVERELSGRKQYSPDSLLFSELMAPTIPLACD
jgi:hypothetical protein